MKGIEVSFITDYKKAFLYLKISSKLFELIVGSNSNNDIIEFGEYPIGEVDEETQNKLNNLHYSLKQTGRFFIIKHNIYHKYTLFALDYPNGYYSYLDKKYYEYKYNNKKYIYVDTKNEKKWKEVIPIKWNINRIFKTLQSNNLSIPLPLYMSPYHTESKTNKEESSKYINNIVMANILRTIHLTKTIKYKTFKDLVKIIDNNNSFKDYEELAEVIFEGPKLSDEEKENVSKLLNNINYKFQEYDLEESNPNEYINNIINRIYELLELNIYDNRKKIKSDVNELIDEYNTKIYNASKSDTLVLEREDIPFLYNKLKNNLEDILKKLSLANTNGKDYIDILKLTDNCIKILNNDSNAVAIDDIEKDILKIKKDILPTINYKTKDILQTFEKEKQRIISHIKDNNEIEEYKNMKEYNIFIRRELQSFLLNVKKELDDKATVKIIQNSYIEIMEGIKVESKNHYINVLLEEIHNNINYIQKEGSYEDNKELSKVIPVLSNKNDVLFNETISKLSTLLKKTYQIIFNMEDKTNQDNLIRKYTVSIKE